MPILEHYITLPLIKKKNVKFLILLFKFNIFGTVLNKKKNMQETNLYYVSLHILIIFLIIMEFSIKPSRYPTSEPRDPDLGRHLRLVTTHVEEAKSKFRRTHCKIHKWASSYYNKKTQNLFVYTCTI